MDRDQPLEPLVERILTVAGTTAVVAVAGPVAVGKSTVAAALADGVRARGRSVAVVATDGFLWPNRVLDAQGLGAEKGTPRTYDLDALAGVVAAARTGHSPLVVPVYSHERYDVEEAPERISCPEVLVVEGVVALQRPFGDLGVYVHADDADVERWYVERFQRLVAAAADDPGSFYGAWVDDPPEEVAAVARVVWEAVNRPNLDQHIRPTMDRAEVVLVKGPDHAIREVRWRRP